MRLSLFKIWHPVHLLWVASSQVWKCLDAFVFIFSPYPSPFLAFSCFWSFFFFYYLPIAIDNCTLLTQHVKKNRDPRWEEEFQFMLEEPPTNDRLHLEVVSASSRMGILHPKVHIVSIIHHLCTSFKMASKVCFLGGTIHKLK